MMKRRLQVLQMEEDKARAEVDAEAADCDAVAEQVHAAILRTQALEERTIQVMNDAQHVREDLRTHLLPRKRQLAQQRDQLKAELQAANTVLVEHTNDHVEWTAATLQRMEAMRRESEEHHQLVHDRMERRLLVELNNVSDELDEEQEKLLELKAVEEKVFALRDAVELMRHSKKLHEGLQLHRAPADAKASCSRQMVTLRAVIAEQQLALKQSRGELDKVKQDTARLAQEFKAVLKAREGLTDVQVEQQIAAATAAVNRLSITSPPQPPPTTDRIPATGTGTVSTDRMSAAVAAAVAKARGRFLRANTNGQAGPHQQAGMASEVRAALQSVTSARNAAKAAAARGGSPPSPAVVASASVGATAGGATVPGSAAMSPALEALFSSVAKTSRFRHDDDGGASQASRSSSGKDTPLREPHAAAGARVRTPRARTAGRRKEMEAVATQRSNDAVHRRRYMAV